MSRLAILLSILLLAAACAADEGDSAAQTVDVPESRSLGPDTDSVPEDVVEAFEESSRESCSEIAGQYFDSGGCMYQHRIFRSERGCEAYLGTWQEGACWYPFPPQAVVGGDLDCEDVGSEIVITGPDPNGFDADNDGIGCEGW